MKSRTYFVNAWVDGLLIGGLSLALYAGIRLFKLDESFHSSAIAITGLLLWVGNWPHFSATTHRLFSDPAHARQFPVTAYGVPILVALAVAAALSSPDVIAPAFVKLFFIWSPYHFSGQTFGITLLYAHRSGAPFNSWERRALWLFVFGTYLSQTARSEAGFASNPYHGVELPTLGLPLWVPQVLTLMMYGAGMAFFGLMAYRSWRTRRLVPWIVVLPALTQYVWFVGGSSVATFQLFVPLMHSLQYQLIALSFYLQQGDAKRESRIGRALHWGLLNFAGGMGMFYLLPRLFVPLGFTLPFASAVILSAVQIHHFFVDGVIWKLRNTVTPVRAALPSRMQRKAS